MTTVDCDSKWRTSVSLQVIHLTSWKGFSFRIVALQVSNGNSFDVSAEVPTNEICCHEVIVSVILKSGNWLGV